MKTNSWQSTVATNALTHPPQLRAGLLHLVENAELEAMRAAIATQKLPIDFEAKLDRLSRQSLMHQFVADNCRTFVRLLVAAHLGAFTDATPSAREILLRVLAYVRKENDAIPDYKPRGFEDDLQEIRAVCSELAPLLQHFKEWRLRHQVPGLWNSPEVISENCQTKAQKAALL